MMDNILKVYTGGNMQHNTVQIERLVHYAKCARELAYAPYSKFNVGAALSVRNTDGTYTIYSGCNIENVSYGMTMCAERVAIYKAISDGRTTGDFDSIVAYAEYDGVPTLPCGACRQVIAEFNIPYTFCANQKDIIGPYTIDEMLLYPFTPNQLNKNL